MLDSIAPSVHYALMEQKTGWEIDTMPKRNPEKENPSSKAWVAWKWISNVNVVPQSLTQDWTNSLF